MDVFVARQPIFDADDEIVAYELLYRGSGSATAAGGVSISRMSTDVIVHSLLGIGMDQLTGGKLAFVNFSREMLLGAAWELFDPRDIVIELLETITLDEEIQTICERLRAAGYRFALDDFVWDDDAVPFLRHAEIVKLDVLNKAPADIEATVEPLRPFPLRLLAERVETAEIHEVCRNLGFELFQGYFYSRPETISRREFSLEQVAIIRLMNLLRDEAVSEQEVEEGFRGDPALSYKLLRIVNAAAFGGRGIDSIRHAIRMIGRAALHRWLALLFVSSVTSDSGRDEERIRDAVARARFCELLAERSGERAAAGPQFLTGLFSVMDVLMNTPLDEILRHVDLAPPIRDALLHGTGPYAPALQIASAYGAADWDAVARLAPTVDVPASDIPELYVQSLTWAREQLLKNEE